MEKIVINDEVIDSLTSHAFINLTRNLTLYGNTLSKAHYTALWNLLDTYTKMAQGEITGRYAFPLGTGMGKTQSIVSWLMALYDCGSITAPDPDPVISVAVCASKVEALCKIKQGLMREGVPDELIGLLHSYAHDPERVGQGEFASLPCTEDNDQKPILLATHNRVKGKGGTHIYNLYRGNPRNLLIWDETLLKSDTRYVRYTDIRQGVAWFKAGVNGTGTARDVLKYLETCREMLDRELNAQKNDEKDAEAIHLPELTPVQLQEYRRVLGTKEVVGPLKALLDMSQEPLRAASTQKNDGLINYDIVVPPELENIVILDASHNIRELGHLDKTIQQVDISENMVSYRNVTVHQLRYASGRSKMTQEFSKKQEDRKVCFEIADVVKGIPDHEGIIIFTFKARPREVDFVQVLKHDLEAQGIDTSATIRTAEKGEQEEQDLNELPPELQEVARQWEREAGEEKPRFVWLTWGNETSLSEYSYCPNVIFAGVLHRDHVDLASAIAGQLDDLTASIPNEKVREVDRSEIAHCLYQAMCRGSCRIIRGEVTEPMQVWLIHSDLSVREVIQKVMPGVNWKEWESRHLLSKGIVELLADRIIEYLDALPDDTVKVSTRRIKQELCLQETAKMTYTRAIEAVTEMDSGWVLDGRSLARAGSVFFKDCD